MEAGRLKHFDYFYPPASIKEARLWIVGGQIIDAGYYKFNDNAPFEEKVSEDGLSFANEMIEMFNLEEAFVIDICLTDEGWKIVEINCINSSDFIQTQT
ncbi:MAG: ATP-grasp domain-containing protein [Crocinitomicaceae bacterium]